MKIRLVGTAQEAKAAAALIATVLTVVEDSGPRQRRGGGLQIQRYLDVRLPPAQPQAPRSPRPDPAADPPDQEAVDFSAWS